MTTEADSVPPAVEATSRATISDMADSKLS